MSIFSAATTVYQHMTTVHGRIDDEMIIPGRINYNEQAQVLQQAREARAHDGPADGGRVVAGMAEAAQLEVQTHRDPGRMRQLEARQGYGRARRAREAEVVARQPEAWDREAEARRARERVRSMPGLGQTREEAWERLRQLRERQAEAAPAQAQLRHEFELEQEQNRQMRATSWCCGVPFFRGVMNFLRILVKDLEE